MKLNQKKIRLLLIISLIIYISYIFIVQENEYKKYLDIKESYTEQIRIAKLKTEEYRKYTEYIRSDEFMERVAREKLGMVYPEEKIYIEINNWLLHNFGKCYIM